MFSCTGPFTFACCLIASEFDRCGSFDDTRGKTNMAAGVAKHATSIPIAADKPISCLVGLGSLRNLVLTSVAAMATAAAIVANRIMTAGSGVISVSAH